MTSRGRAGSQPRETRPAAAPIEGDMQDVLEEFRRSLDPERFPAMIAHVEWHQTDPEANEFEFVLDLILDGLEA